jgi:hypothetical protein
MIFNEIQYPLGDGATDFSMFPQSNLYLIFAYCKAEFLANMEKQESESKLLDTLRAYVTISAHINPYYNFYMDIYVFFFFFLRKQHSKISDMLKNFLSASRNWCI